MLFGKYSLTGNECVVVVAVGGVEGSQVPLGGVYGFKQRESGGIRHKMGSVVKRLSPKRR